MAIIAGQRSSSWLPNQTKDICNFPFAHARLFTYLRFIFISISNSAGKLLPLARTLGQDKSLAKQWDHVAWTKKFSGDEIGQYYS